MAQNAYAGLAASSRDNTTLQTVTFDNVSITSGAIPNVSSLSPYSGGVGTSVTINGTDFGATQGTSTVTFNGVPAASVTSWGNTQIVATVPSTVPAGPGAVVLTVSSVASNATILFTAFNPVITSLSPPSAPTNGLIAVTGSGFGATQGASQIQFNGIAGHVLSWGDSSISVQVPSGSTTGPVTVTVNGFASNGVTFTLTSALSITTISPAEGAVGSTATITGAGFGGTQSDSAVTFNGTPVSSIVSWSDTSIIATVPSGASTGPVTVEVASATVDGPSFEVSATTTLTDSLGNNTSFTTVMVGGKWYVSNATGSGCSTCTLRGNIANTFDGHGNILSTTDELGYTASYSYDSNNNVTSVTQPSVSGGTPTTSYTYNSFGEVLTSTDPLGNVTTNTYDSHGNLTSVTTPAPGGGAAASVTQFAYNSLGELTQITDPLGHATT